MQSTSAVPTKLPCFQRIARRLRGALTTPPQNLFEVENLPIRITMGEEYFNDLKMKLDRTNYFVYIVQKVLKTNYHKMNFKEMKTEIDGLLGLYLRTKIFVFLWGASVAYSAYNSPDKYFLLPVIGFGYDNNVDMKRLVMVHCGELFREFPRLAYLKTSPLHSNYEIRLLIENFTKPENKKFLDFWKKADNNDTPTCPDVTETDANVKLLKELKMKCQEIDKQIDNLKQIKEDVLEIQEKLQQSAIYTALHTKLPLTFSFRHNELL